MATHHVYGTLIVAGAAAARQIDVIEGDLWGSSGLAAAIVGSTTSDAGTGAWDVPLNSDALVYVAVGPVTPYKMQLLGPFRPEPL